MACHGHEPLAGDGPWDGAKGQSSPLLASQPHLLRAPCLPLGVWPRAASAGLQTPADPGALAFQCHHLVPSGPGTGYSRPWGQKRCSQGHWKGQGSTGDLLADSTAVGCPVSHR